jgi:hypothetical protein
MIEFIAGVVRAAIETFTFPEPILELGSYLVEGQEQLADLRRYFPEKHFTGVDRRAGPGVDALEDVENLSWGDATAGTVIALNLFEHVEHFWRGFDEMQRILRADGLLFISCPFDLHIHDYPKDYWRFTPDPRASWATMGHGIDPSMFGRSPPASLTRRSRRSSMPCFAGASDCMLNSRCRGKPGSATEPAVLFVVAAHLPVIWKQRHSTPR